MSETSCIIVGASHAGTTLALQLRKEGWAGAIQLLSAEAEQPYHRPPLSKDYLAGTKTIDGMRLRPEKIYRDNDIELRLDTSVASIDTVGRSVTLDGGVELPFAKLALCTGATVRKLPLGEALANIFYIRTAADVAPIIEQAAAGRRAVIIGAGYIGLETAAVLAQQGVQVTVLEMEQRILARVTGELMSDYIAALHRSHGVEIVTSTRVVDIQGSDAVSGVICDDGREYQTDFVIVGIGVTPNTQLAEAAGLQLNNGVLVNQHAETSHPDIYAAGDCSCYPSMLYDRLLRLESVQNANDQARIVAANICGKRLAYDAVPWFWSDQYQIKLQMAGISAGFDRVISRGDVENKDARGFALFYMKQGVLIAADCVGRPREFMLSKQLVKAKAVVDPLRLQDETLEPASFLPV